jgi:hypothetical protein
MLCPVHLVRDAPTPDIGSPISVHCVMLAADQVSRHAPVSRVWQDEAETNGYLGNVGPSECAQR